MHQPIKIAAVGGDCSNGVTCPGVWDNGDPDHVYVQGTTTTAGDIGLSDIPEHETLVRIPRTMWDAR
ncbi:hypothetical protein [Actinopolymorpha alba]|uniref:hypothetical protein n=1 Tax=Actinopolymorpha alba TaxID=533267 RepID=UPI000361BE8D|nr:hypothetical protein [Actinopolymorpha alba]